MPSTSDEKMVAPDGGFLCDAVWKLPAPKRRNHLNFLLMWQLGHRDPMRLLSAHRPGNR